MFNRNYLPALPALAATLVLCACGTTSLSTVEDGRTLAPVWPAPERARPILPATRYVQPAVLEKVVPGMSKPEVFRVLGHPMHREGVVGVHEWDYLFHLPAGEADRFVECQYKLIFDDDMRLGEIHWRSTQCAQLVAAKVAPVANQTSTTMDLAADTLFEFDSAQLSAGAPSTIERQVLRVLKEVQRIQALRVIGYSDHLGSPTHNLHLSLRRAEAVKSYLVAQGVPASAVQVEGRGSADPVVQCERSERNSLIACLKPNRRVRIEVVAR